MALAQHPADRHSGGLPDLNRRVDGSSEFPGNLLILLGSSSSQVSGLTSEKGTASMVFGPSAPRQRQNQKVGAAPQHADSL
jgi:hypothetical protein